ncbi:Ig-like domain (group 3) [Parafrankia irregularis]|uniref:Ig-like domain (Group 3) n=1 Tax=Parafrankia irregularis TaxID=795642 RepID=A0A0S4QYE2_9ACTN|nr:MULTISPECIES: Ig-like domain-containing protein [Parafrankia]MBE3203621.1 Ig-like domain repeat protein [Parafrankia sp. CH37]CUU60557.1 Ig-like domain (group 3) [Parafrankia irregularis]
MGFRLLTRSMSGGPSLLVLAATVTCGFLVAGCEPTASGPGGGGPTVTAAPTPTTTTPAPSPTRGATPTAGGPTSTPVPTTPTTPAPTTSQPSASPSAADTRIAVQAAGNVRQGGIDVGVATVPGAGTPWPTGTIKVYEGSALLGTVTIKHGDMDPYSMGGLDITLAPGYHTLTLDYSGDATYRPDRRTMAANIANAQIIASIPGGTVVWAESYSVDIEVKGLPGVSGTPSGKVRNRENFGLPSFEATLDANGRATLEIDPSWSGTAPFTAPRANAIFIEYLGDDDFVPTTLMVEFTEVPNTP